MGGSPADSREETNALRTLQINGTAGVLTAKWSCEDEPETFITPPGMLQLMLKGLSRMITTDVVHQRQ